MICHFVLIDGECGILKEGHCRFIGCYIDLEFFDILSADHLRFLS